VKVRVKFIPTTVAEYFDSKSVEFLELPDGSKYRDLIEVLKKRFEKASGEASKNTSQGSLFDTFAMICDGMPVLRKLDELIDPDKEVLVVAMALGG